MSFFDFIKAFEYLTSKLLKDEFDEDSKLDSV
jgi:hypothetical protein